MNKELGTDLLVCFCILWFNFLSERMHEHQATGVEAVPRLFSVLLQMVSWIRGEAKGLH